MSYLFAYQAVEDNPELVWLLLSVFVAAISCFAVLAAINWLRGCRK